MIGIWTGDPDGKISLLGNEFSKICNTLQRFLQQTASYNRNYCSTSRQIFTDEAYRQNNKCCYQFNSTTDG